MITFKKIQEDIEEFTEAAPQEGQPQIDPMMIRAKAGEFFMRVRAASTAAHAAHLMTHSYAQHKALGDFYEEIIPLIDAFMESFIGRYGIPDAFPPVMEKSYDPITIMGNLTKWIDGNRMIFPNSELQNVVDEMLTLVNSTSYKLRELK